MREDLIQLFVYGTLKPGEFYHAQIAAHVRRARTGFITGVLRDQGRWPVLVPGEGAVRGVLLDLHAEALPIVDEIEGYQPERGAREFVRTRTRVHLESADSIEAWVYTFGDPQQAAHFPHCAGGSTGGTPLYEWHGRPA